MSIEFTPELEKLVEERVKEKEREMYEQFGELVFWTVKKNRGGRKPCNQN